MSCLFGRKKTQHLESKLLPIPCFTNCFVYFDGKSEGSMPFVVRKLKILSPDRYSFISLFRLNSFVHFDGKNEEEFM